MDYKSRPLYGRLGAWIAGIILGLCFSHINATTTSVVLYNSINVVVGQQATYNCSITGSGPDPSVAWKMTSTSGDPIAVSFNVQTTGTDNAMDGTLLSSNTFLVQSSHLNQRLWCSVTDVGSTSTSYQIFTHITETSATTANLGETCSPNIQCTPTNSECRNSVCVCRTGYRTNGNTCNLIGIGESCAGSTCLPANSFCNFQSVCACNTGFYELSGSCLQKKNLGETCTAGNNVMCGVAFSACSSLPPYTCVCQSGYTPSGNSCLLSSALVGQSCVNPTRTCSTSNTECDVFSTGTCRCLSGFTQSGSSCILGTAGLGDNCTSPARACDTTNSECNSTSGLCECTSGYLSNGTHCVSNGATLGQACINPTRTCGVQYSVCREGTCQCDVGYILNGNVCQIPNLGQACTVNVGCQQTATGGTTTNPQCIFGRCACPTEYYTYTNVCYQKSTTGVTCDDRVLNSCQDDQASCTGSPATCTCNFGYTFVSGFCIIVNSSQCPVNTQIPSTRTGVSNAPDVYVGATCYQVDFGASNTMHCLDTKRQAALQYANWFKMPGYTAVTKSTGGFINGDTSNTNMTVSNAQNVYAGNYICTLCYGSGLTRCTNSSQVQLLVIGAAIGSTSLTASPSGNIVRGGSLTFTCGTSPAGVASSFTFYKDNNDVQSGPSNTYFIASVQAVHDGSYTCRASNSNSQQTSTGYVIFAQYKPEYFLSGGGDTQTVYHDFADGAVQITCSSIFSNPPVTSYRFYNSSGSLLIAGPSPTYLVTGEQGYQIYRCTAENTLGVSNAQYIEVELPGTSPDTGAATENDGIGTGAIVAIVLGIIFFILLIIIIIVCCCSYGWCRKKEKIEPEVIVQPPREKPYIPRTITSASPSVRTSKDVGVMVVPVTEEFEQIYTATPRYHLRPAVHGGPIISLMDDSFEKPQPRPLQLPALDTQYLYADADADEPKRRHRKKRRKHSRRRHQEERGPSEEDLVVITDTHRYENGGGRHEHVYYE